MSTSGYFLNHPMVPLNPLITKIFEDPKNGSAHNISKEGCVALARAVRLYKDKGIWNEWRKAFPVRTVSSEQGLLRQNTVDFSGMDFTKERLDFSDLYFGDHANFSNSKWGDVDFTRATFGDYVNFSRSQWGIKSTDIGPFVVNFWGSNWGRAAIFNESKWGKIFGDFSHSTWGQHASFKNSNFYSWSFVNARFLGDVNFSGINCEREFALCNGLGAHAYIQGQIDLSGAKFKGIANFNGQRFRAKTDFTYVTFDKWAPTFHGAQLHPDTTFEQCQFPKITGNQDNERAYRTLKLAYKEFCHINEQLFFSRKEMAEEEKSSRLLNKPWFLLYRLTCNYGQSIWLPLSWFFISVIVFAWCYGYYDPLISPCIDIGAQCNLQTNWLAYSFSQSLPFSIESANHLVASGPDFQNSAHAVIVATQKVLASILLFLTGLGVRNLFKFN